MLKTGLAKIEEALVTPQQKIRKEFDDLWRKNAGDQSLKRKRISKDPFIACKPHSSQSFSLEKGLSQGGGRKNF